MTHTTSLAFDRQVAGTSSSPTNSIVRSRIAAAAALTVATVAIGVALGLALGPVAILMFVLPLPVPLILLWLSTDVLRADERDSRRGR
jgi:hypothetical protein